MEKNSGIFTDNINFEEVISRRTAYGLIWGGKYKTKPCVIKMIMLTSGIHFDKIKNIYRNGDKVKIKDEEAEKYFSHDDEKPFYHTDFRHRRSMTTKAFLSEVAELINLAEIGLAPQVYGYGICDQSYNIHYGFVVMERVDCSLKDIYMRRPLTSSENKTVEKLIDKLHEKHGLAHGDMKPSNIGAYLDKNGYIIKCCFFDCQKIRHKEKCGSRKFQQLVERDWDVYERHIIKNREKDSKRLSSEPKHPKLDWGQSPHRMMQHSPHSSHSSDEIY